MVINKINELREKLNEKIINNNTNKEEILDLSRKLDEYIAIYLKNIDSEEGNIGLVDED